MDQELLINYLARIPSLIRKALKERIKEDSESNLRNSPDQKLLKCITEHFIENINLTFHRNPDNGFKQTGRNH